MSTDPVPQRLSDADRDAAVGMLRQHFSEGRLDEAEFDQRMGAALAARYATDLSALFDDLPEPRPAPAGDAASGPAAWQQWTPSPQAPAAAPVPWTAQPPAVPDARSRGLSMAQALIWPVCIVLLLTTGWFWWIFVAIIGGIILRQLNGPRRTPPPQLGP